MKRFNCDFASRFRILKGGKISLVVSALLGSAIIASAAPTGGVVTSGSATISQNANTTNINQSTQKASINWQNFNIASNETVNFNQPNANSITLNRVVGNEKSIINGALNANGQVWILNSNGILFNSTAKINTAGLVASTAELSDKDFQDGNYNFKNSKSNSVVNLGTIDVSNNGYVVLASNEVRNSGTIKAIKGKVFLSGNSEYTINLNGNSIVNLIVTKGVLDAMVENSGTIIANGGEIYLTTNAVNELLKGVVNNTGIIEANSLDDVTGKVEVYAHGGTANVSGEIKAEGGFVETSGKDLKVAEQTKIKAKKWLIDPTDVVIESGGTVSAETISTYLAEDRGAGDPNQMEIQAIGNITVNQAVNVLIDDVTDGGLTLIAGKDININKEIKVGASANLTLNYGWDGVTSWISGNEGTIYGNGGKITFGMTADKTNFAGKVTLQGSTSSMFINKVEQIVIHNAYDLQAMNYPNLTKNFVLANDIDLSTYLVDGTTWTPIGSPGNRNYYGDEFSGSFNGLGHTISNLTLNGDFNTGIRDGHLIPSAGLFGNIAGAANISGVRLANASITNTANYNDWDENRASPTAALVGEARAQYQSGNFVAAPTIHNNIVTGSTIQASGTGSNVAAIVGYANGATISGNAVTTTTISSANGYSVGGIVGLIYSREGFQSTITDSYVASSSIKSAYGEVGGIVGYMEGVIVDNATVKDSYIYTTGTIQGSYAAGGIVGDSEYYEGNDTEYYSEIKNSSVENSTIAAMQDAGGLVGYMDNSTRITNSFYNLINTEIGDKTGDNVGNNVAGVITYGGIDNSEYTVWLSGSKVALSATSLLGAADSNGYYSIDNVADFRKMLALAYDPINKFKLTNHITLTSVDAGLYLPVLRGELNGNSKAIIGLNVSQSYNSYIGLIGRLEGGTVKNLMVVSPTLNGYSYVGGIAGNATQNYEGTKSPSISDVVVDGFIYSYTKKFDVASQHIDTGIYNIGAIAGNFENGTLSNVHASSEYSASTITIDLTANNEGYDSVSAEYIGGLLGSMYNSTLDIASSDVNISVVLESKAHTNFDAWNGNSVGAYTIGGLIGEGARNSLIKDVTANGAINVKTTREITVADDWEGDAWMGSIGGLFGYMGQSYIKNGTATNAIAIENNHEINSIGGIAGYSYKSFYDTATTSGDITITLNNGATWFEDIGGAFGYTSASIIKDVDSTRNITTIGTTVGGGDSIGGLVGDAQYTNIISSSYVGTIDVNSLTGEISNIGGLVGNNYGYIENREYANYSKTIAAGESIANKEAAKTAALAAYNLRADVIALKALGYTVFDDSDTSALDGTKFDIRFYIVTPDNTEWGIIKDSTASVNIKAQNAINVGGLVGNMNTENGGQIINSSVTALNDTSKIEGYSNVGGLVGKNSYGNITDSHAAINVKANSTDTEQGSNVGGLVGYNEGGSRSEYVYPEFTPISYNSDAEAQAALDAVKAAFIAAQLAANPGYELDYANAGVWNYNNIPNTILVEIGLVKSKPIGSIKNSYATGAVEGAKNVGGLVGYADTTTIDSSYSTGTVNGKDSVGGLVGYATGSKIIDSYHTTGKVTGANGTEGITGGLVGNLYDNNLISGSYATSEVVGESGVGGLIGSAYSSSVKNSYATGKVTATGLDNNGVMQAFAGGFAGGFAFGSISQSYATGDVVASGEGAGGLLGGNFENEIKESYATGKVTGTSKVGGLIGLDMRLDSGSTISDVYSSGEVVASGNDVGSLIGSANGTTLTNSYSSGKITLTGSDQLTVNGLIGNNADATVTNSFYDKIVNPEMLDETTHGKSTEELQTLATFTGIQSNPWDMSGENGGYATLNLSADRTNVWKMAKAGPTAAELAVIAALEAATNAKNNTLTATGNVSTSLTTANGAVTSANTANTAINTAISNVERLTTPSDIQGVITTISSNITTLTNAKTTAQTALQTAQTAKALAEQKAILAQTAYNTALSAGATIEQLSAVLALVNEANSAVTSATTALATTQTQVSTLDGLINVANTKLAVVNTINSSLEAATNAKVATLNATSNVTTAISTATSAITTATVASESINTTISNIEGTVNLALVQSAINTISNNITTLTNAKTTAQTALQTAQTAKALAEQKAILAKTAYDTALSEGATIEQLSAVLALVNEANSAVTSATTALAVVQVQYNTLDNMITIANLDKIEVEKYASDLAISNQNTEKAVTAAIKAPVIPVIQVIPTITAPKINVDVKPATQIKQDVALSLGISDIKNVSLVSQTTVGQSNQVISMSDLKPLSSTNTENTDVAEVRVPLSQNSIVDLVNGGVTLPTGVDQQFFVVATDNTTTNSSTTTTTNENNKNKKGKKAN